MNESEYLGHGTTSDARLEDAHTGIRMHNGLGHSWPQLLRHSTQNLNKSTKRPQEKKQFTLYLSSIANFRFLDKNRVNIYEKTMIKNATPQPPTPHPPFVCSLGFHEDNEMKRDPQPRWARPHLCPEQLINSVCVYSAEPRPSPFHKTTVLISLSLIKRIYGSPGDPVALGLA